jgi:hypothetical protein
MAGAVELVASALAIMRVVQHMRNPMNSMDRQTFGLPGDAPSAILDYVVVGDALTASHHLIDARALRLMPTHSYLINAGRGGLVHLAALIEALNTHSIAGAALDVFTPEPLPATDPILGAANLIATPHIAGVTDVSYAATAHCVREALHAIRGRNIPASVNADDLRASPKPTKPAAGLQVRKHLGARWW